MGRTFLIGDVHGHAELLGRLLEAIRPRAEEGDRLVFLGDLINRGPDARGVVDTVLQERERWPGPVVALMGNHELEFRWALRERSRGAWRREGFQVFGHSPQPGNRPLNLPDRIGLDTGCGTKGGPLTAVMLPEREFFHAGADL